MIVAEEVEGRAPQDHGNVSGKVEDGRSQNHSEEDQNAAVEHNPLDRRKHHHRHRHRILQQ